MEEFLIFGLACTFSILKYFLFLKSLHFFASIFELQKIHKIYTNYVPYISEIQLQKSRTKNKSVWGIFTKFAIHAKKYSYTVGPCGS
jgi:hypothetical protein